MGQTPNPTEYSVGMKLEVVHLNTCLNPRYTWVTKAASAVPVGVKVYGHSATNNFHQDEIKWIEPQQDSYTPSRAAGLSKFVTLEWTEHE